MKLNSNLRLIFLIEIKGTNLNTDKLFWTLNEAWKQEFSKNCPPAKEQLIWFWCWFISDHLIRSHSYEPDVIRRLFSHPKRDVFMG